jgi:hypothetical protein
VNANPVGATDAFGLFAGDPSDIARRIILESLMRAGAADAAAGGAANPIADAAAAGVLIGTIGYEIYDLCRPTPECERLYAIAEAAKDIVVSRYFALLYDRWDQYNTAFDVPKVSRGTTWVGHQKQYREAQRVLQKAIDALLAAGCTPSPEQLKWARQPAPDMPLGQKKSRFPTK